MNSDSKHSPEAAIPTTKPALPTTKPALHPTELALMDQNLHFRTMQQRRIYGNLPLKTAMGSLKAGLEIHLSTLMGQSDTDTSNFNARGPETLPTTKNTIQGARLLRNRWTLELLPVVVVYGELYVTSREGINAGQ